MKNLLLFKYLTTVLRIRNLNFSLANKYLSNYNGLNAFIQSSNLINSDANKINLLNINNILVAICSNFNMIIGNIKYLSTFNEFTLTIYFYSASTVYNDKIQSILLKLATVLSKILNKEVAIKLIRVRSPLAFGSIASIILNNYINNNRRNRVLKTLARKFNSLNNNNLTQTNFIKGLISGISLNFNGRSNFDSLANRKLKAAFIAGKMNKANVLFNKLDSYSKLNTKGIYTVKVNYSYNK